jgi:hypothetical protein
VTSKIVDAKGIEALRHVLFRANNNELKLQCFWALANIANESEEYRNLVAVNGVFEYLLAFVESIKDEKIGLIINGLWSLGSFIKYKNPPECVSSGMSEAFDLFLEYLDHEHDRVMKEAFACITYMSEDETFSDRIIEGNVVDKAIKLLDEAHKDDQYHSHLLRIFGNLAYGNYRETQILIDFKVIPKLKVFFSSQKPKIVKEVAWMISNVSCGGETYIQEIVDAGIYIEIIKCLAHVDKKVRREASYAIFNTLEKGSFEHAKYLVVNDLLRNLTKLLEDKDDEICTNALDSFVVLYSKGKYNCFEFVHVNLFAVLIDKYGGKFLIQNIFLK